VDTHVHRISNRLGLIRTKTPEETEPALKRIIPKKYWKKINYLMVRFGQKVCLPRNPKCHICNLAPMCRYFKENGVRMRLQEKNGQFSMTLPKATIEGIGWKKTDAIQFKVASNDRLDLVKEPTQN